MPALIKFNLKEFPALNGIEPGNVATIEMEVDVVERIKMGESEEILVKIKEAVGSQRPLSGFNRLVKIFQGMRTKDGRMKVETQYTPHGGGL